jgi:tetraacyldisaccharide 4'-kinase
LVGGHAPDEAALLGRRLPGTPVFADRDRVASARRAVSGGANVLVLDDGFQHRRVRRDLDVVLLAAEDPFPGRVLPTGPYREGMDALARADVVVVTRRMAARGASQRLAEAVEERLPGRVAGGVALEGRGWTDLDGVAVPAPTGDVLAVCGLARPEGFRAAVEATATGVVELVAFPDHHAYTARELRRLAVRAAGRPVAVTEKDARGHGR